MNIKDIIGKNIAVHCDFEEKAVKFLQECEKRGFRWFSGDKPTCYTNWDLHKSHTCYAVSDDGIIYSCVEYCINNRYKIIEYDDILFED